MVALAYIGAPKMTREPPAVYSVGQDRPSFSALPHAILFDNALSHGAIVLYAVLQSHWWQGGECRASHATLAAQLGVKERMLRYHLKALIDAGYVVERPRGKGQAKAYAPVETPSKRQYIAASDPPTGNGLPVEDAQPAMDCQFKRQPIAASGDYTLSTLRSIEEDTGGDAANAARPPTKSTPEKRSTRLAEGWALTIGHYEAAARCGFDRPRADLEAQKFSDHHRANGSRMVDWLAAWRTWLRNAVEFDARNAQRRNGSATVSTLPGRRPISDEARRAAAEWEQDE